MSSFWLSFVLFTFVATVYGINVPSTIISNKLQSFLPSQLNKSNFTLDDAKKLLYKKCRSAINADSTSAQAQIENIEKAARKLMKCANDIADVSVFLAEVEAARPTGDLDMVFQKYCERVPQAEQCLKEFNEHLLICLTPAERAQNDIMMRIVATLLDFVCYRDGEQIALFISEEGPECLEANKDNISNCMNATFGAYVTEMSLNELPELVIGPKQCIDLHDFEECVLSYLEKCNEVTPANIVESLFRYVRNETKCQEDIEKATAFHESNVHQQRNVAVEFRNVFSYPLNLIALCVPLLTAGMRRLF